MGSGDNAIYMTITLCWYVMWPIVILTSLYFAKIKNNKESVQLLSKSLIAWVLMLITTVLSTYSVDFENFSFEILSFVIFIITMAYSILGIVSLLPNNPKKHNKNI